MGAILLNNVGTVTIVNGTANGLEPDPELWHVLSQFPGLVNPGLPNPEIFTEVGDRFGAALAVGDFDGDGDKDLAVGAPGERATTTLGPFGAIRAANAGSVSIFSNSGGGCILLDFAQFFTLVNIEIPREANDEFGAALAANDFNGDQFTDLAIGVPGRSIGGAAGAGAVVVIYGDKNGLSTSATLTHPASQFWHESVDGIASSSAAGDRFGSSLSAWNFGNGSQADLAIGVPFDTVVRVVSIVPLVTQLIPGAGAVHALYGSSQGLTTIGAQFLTQNFAGVPDDAEADDHFGLAVY